MESAPLTLAHSHARSAVAELSKANSSVASAEHGLAAGEFAKAASGTEDSEALRILKLLEEYHHALAKTIKDEPRVSPYTKAHYDASTGLTLTSGSPVGDRPRAQSPPPTVSSPSKPQSRQRPRDLSSSIASNLASARGIPGAQRRGAPISPTVTAHTVAGSGSTRSRQRTRELSPSSAVEAARRQLRGDEDSTIPRSVVQTSLHYGSQRDQDATAANTGRDTAFNRFYSNFEGYFSTLSAPLVFAGFPLSPAANATAPEPGPSHVVSKDRQSSSDKSRAPDLKNIFSQSALRALKGAGGINAAAESFYVVPTSGGTVSYAQMLNQSKIAGEHRTSTSTEVDEFVDASETPYPPSPTRSRHFAKASPSSSRHTPAAGGKVRRNKTQEELELETKQQRDIIDNLSKRLVQFETHSQSQRLALAQSMHSQRPSSRNGEGRDAASDIPPVPPLPKASAPSAAEGGEKLEQDPHMEELRASLAELQRENAKLTRESERRAKVISQYREKWEELKTAARKKAREREDSTAAASVTKDSDGKDEQAE